MKEWNMSTKRWVRVSAKDRALILNGDGTLFMPDQTCV